MTSRPPRSPLARRLGTAALLARLLGAMRVATAASTIVASVAVGGCLAPTLPLPPPEEPDSVESIGDGQWAIRGTCSPGALVIGVVERTGIGAAVEDRDADGRYSIVVSADACDIVEVWQRDGEETSATTRVVLQPVANGTVIDPDACLR